MSPANPLVVNGRFEDATIFEALHIIGWLKKTGRLRIEAPPVRGIVLMRKGLVVGAYTQSSLGRMREIGQGWFSGDKQESIKRQILAALHDYADLTRGAFSFLQERTLSAPELGQVDLAEVTLEPGLNPNQLALILAHERDEKRHVNLGSGITQPEKPKVVASRHPFSGESQRQRVDRIPGLFCIVLFVDDEAPVRDVVGSEMRLAGYEVRMASGPGEAIAIALELARSKDKRFMVVTDLGMPSTSGKNFLGGFELLRNLVEGGIQVPAVLTTESISKPARYTAKRLGVYKVAFKPSLSKLDPEQYQRDLRSFASLLVKSLKEIEPGNHETRDRMGEDGKVQDPVAKRFLTSLGEQLLDPKRSVHTSNHVLPVAACIASSKNKKKNDHKNETRPSVFDQSSLRRHERIGSLMISATFSAGNNTGDGYVTDLSEKGAFLSTTKLLPVGQIIRLRVSLPYQQGEVSTEAQIVWLSYREHGRGSAPHGMGVAFVGPFN